MQEGFIALFQGISNIFGSFFDMAFLGTNLGLLLVAFAVVSMVMTFLIRRYM